MVIMPTQDNLVIKLPEKEKEQITKSGIILTSSSVHQDLPEKGEVIAVGTGRILNNGTLLEPSVKKGDTVIFNRFAGTKITSEEKEYLIIKENDVLAVIR